MQHRELRSNMIMSGRKTSPVAAWRPQDETRSYPVHPKPLQAVHQQRHNGVRSFQASFFRQAQVMAEDPPFGHFALREQTSHTTSLAEQASLKQLAFEGETSQSKTPLNHPSAGFSQLDLAQLEHKMLELDALKEEVRKFVAKLPPASTTELAEVDCQQSSDNNNNNNNNDDNNNNNNTTTTNNNNNSNNELNNYNNNSKSSQESSLNSVDLDNDNPESEQDLESTSFSFLIPTLGAEFRQDKA